MSGDATRLMLLVKSIDPSATLALSEYTGCWYVTARISIGDGVMLAGITEHHTTPERAVTAFFDRLTGIGVEEYLATDYRGHRREWRWNGAAFVEQTRAEALPSSSAGL